MLTSTALWVQDPRWQGSCRQLYVTRSRETFVIAYHKRTVAYSDCEVSRISSSMRTMPWLCGKKDNKYDSAIHSKFALPRPRYLPCVGESRLSRPLATVKRSHRSNLCHSLGDSFTTWYGYTLVRFTRVENDKAKEYYDSESLRVVLVALFYSYSPSADILCSPHNLLVDC